MSAGVDVQQHAGHRPTLPPAAVGAAFSRFPHQSGALQQHLDAGVAVGDAVLFAELFVEVTHAEIEILFTIPAQHLLSDHPGHALGAGASLTAIQQAIEAAVAVALQHPAQMARAHAQDPRGLPKGDLPADCSQDNFLHFHSPLPGLLRIARHRRYPRLG